MRVMLVEPGPNFSVSDVARGWGRGFESLGCEVVRPNLSDRLDFYSRALIERDGANVKAFDDKGAVQMAAQCIETAAYQTWPDVVFIVSCFFIPPRILELLRHRGHKVVILHTESPYEDDGQLQRVPYADLNLINDPTNIEKFREVGRTEYQWHCYDPDLHYPHPPTAEYSSDFCFVGTSYPSRVDFLEKVDWTGVDVALGGNWAGIEETSVLRPFVAHPLNECLENSDAVELYASTKLSANLYRVEAEKPEYSTGWSMSPRELELAACGVPFLRQRRGENDELLGMLPTFETPAEFSQELRWWLDHDDARESVAHAARAAVADRTFHNAAKRLLGLLGV